MPVPNYTRAGCIGGINNCLPPVRSSDRAYKNVFFFFFFNALMEHRGEPATCTRLSKKGITILLLRAG